MGQADLLSTSEAKRIGSEWVDDRVTAMKEGRMHPLELQAEAMAFMANELLQIRITLECWLETAAKEEGTT